MIYEHLKALIPEYCPAVQVCRTTMIPATYRFGEAEKLRYQARHIHGHSPMPRYGWNVIHDTVNFDRRIAVIVE